MKRAIFGVSRARRNAAKLGRWHRFCKEESGSEIVEFALSLPVLLMVTVGGLEVLLFLASLAGATYGSRTAVRFAATHGASSLVPCTAASLTTLVLSYQIGFPGGKVTVTPTWSPTNTVGSTVSVKVSVAYPTGIPYSKLSSMAAKTTASGVIMQ
jgi:Flp pilus assembly protein TadG